MISSLNIAVFQCVGDIFDGEQIKKCTGGFIVLGLLSGQLMCMVKFLFDGLYAIRKFVFSLQESFNILMKKSPIPNPPLKKKLAKKNETKSERTKYENTPPLSSKNVISSKNMFKKKFKDIAKFTNEDNDLIQYKKNYRKSSKKKVNAVQTDMDKIDEESNENLATIKELLSNSFDETDFDDSIEKDKRKFCEYFCEIFKSNQLFINAIFVEEIMRPRALKILILIMTIELYFAITALFYNEDYLSELFNSEEEDSFFAFVPRRFNQFVYTSAVSGIISYVIGYFFIEENKLKRVFLRNKNDNVKLKYELSVIVKDLGKRFIVLIIVSILLSIICFVYISCFNIVYPYIRGEWLKASIFILLIMQLINFLLAFFHTCIRFISLRYNSEKLFKLSLWLL